MHEAENWRLLLIGASGAIGGTIAALAVERGWSVVATSRGAASLSDSPLLHHIVHDPLTGKPGQDFAGQAPFDAVCWAHGANLADSLHSFDADAHKALYDANVLSIMLSISGLIDAGLLAAGGARLTIISSIWQERARQNKLSYTVTKAAVGGLVRSAAVDLGTDGHLINGVLPGVLETPMTRANLTADQIASVSGKTQHGRLSDLNTVADTVLFLCSAQNKSITGQSVTVDLGMSNASIV